MEEGAAPGAGRAPAAPPVAGRARAARPAPPPWSRAELQRARHPGSSGWSADSKPSSSTAVVAVARAREQRLAARRAAGSSTGAGPTGRARGPPRRPRRSSANAHAAPRPGSAAARCTRIQASVMTPRVPSEPSNRRSGLGPAPEPGRRRVSTGPGGVTRAATRRSRRCGCRGGEVAAGAGGDPAAQRGELERLREVAQREAVRRGAASSSAGPGRPAWMRAARETRVDLEHAGRGAPGRRRPRRGSRSTPRLDAAHHAGAAAVGDRRGAGGGAPVEHRSTSASSRGKATRSGGCANSPAEAAHHVAVGLAVACAGTLVRVDGADRGERGGRRRAAAQRSSRSSTRAARSTSVSPKPRAATQRRRGASHLLVGRRWSS